MNDLKILCVDENKIITYADYIACFGCGVGHCQTYKKVTAGSAEEHLQKVYELTNAYLKLMRKNKLKRILDEI